MVFNDTSYYVPAIPFATLPFLKPLQGAAFAGGLAPVTVVRLSASNASLSGLEQAISGFEVDDVWNEGFIEGTWMQGVVLLLNLWDFVVIIQIINVLYKLIKGMSYHCFLFLISFDLL